MLINFEKWHGTQNDFILCWVSQSQYSNIVPTLQRKAKEFCERSTGIGADGLIVIVHSAQSTSKQLLIINSDGSIARTCGNGIRCAALSVYQHSLLESKTPIESVELQLEEQIYNCQFVPQKSGVLPLVQVNMGIPTLDKANSWHEAASNFVRLTLQQHKLTDWMNDFHTCALANQHLVFLLEEEADIATMRTLGRALQSSPHWDGINVNFVSPLVQGPPIPTGMRGRDLNESYKVFIWERGAGETQACGSGACAVATSLLSSGLFERTAWVPTLFPGGWLFVRQDEEGEELTLCGPAIFVYSGSIEI